VFDGLFFFVDSLILIFFNYKEGKNPEKKKLQRNNLRGYKPLPISTHSVLKIIWTVRNKNNKHHLMNNYVWLMYPLID
jgi:hypothetical protein